MPVAVGADLRRREREGTARVDRDEVDGDVVVRVGGPRRGRRGLTDASHQLTGPYHQLVPGVRVARALHVLGPVHDERGVDHLAPRGEVEPDLEVSQRVRGVVVDEWKHLAVDDPFARGHPLDVALAVPSGVAHRVRVVHQSLHRGGDGLEPSVRMLRKPRDALAVVHPVIGGRIEISPVASPGRSHLPIAGRVLVVVVDREEEGIWGLERKRQTLDLLDRAHRRAQHRRAEKRVHSASENTCWKQNNNRKRGRVRPAR